MNKDLIHNNIKSKKIRDFNEDFNIKWVSRHKLIGLEAQKSFEFDVDENQKVLSNPYMLVWLRNLDRLKKLLPKDFNFHNFNLIDVGCGCGISTIYLNENFIFKTITGFDFSNELIKKAKKNYSFFYKDKKSFNSINFEVADAKYYQILNFALRKIL